MDPSRTTTIEEEEENEENIRKEATFCNFQIASQF
jgi:hypothetical protein